MSLLLSSSSFPYITERKNAVVVEVVDVNIAIITVVTIMVIVGKINVVVDAIASLMSFTFSFSLLLFFCYDCLSHQKIPTLPYGSCLVKKPMYLKCKYFNSDSLSNL